MRRDDDDFPHLQDSWIANRLLYEHMVTKDVSSQVH
jgi:hypothetical protein